MQIHYDEARMTQEYELQQSDLVRGVYRLVDAYGMPLELALEFMQSTNQMVDWVDYSKAALADGKEPEAIKARILEAVKTVYGKRIERRMRGIL
jgi:alanyl-tRNA synthetase